MEYRRRRWMTAKSLRLTGAILVLTVVACRTETASRPVDLDRQTPVVRSPTPAIAGTATVIATANSGAPSPTVVAKVAQSPSVVVKVAPSPPLAPASPTVEPAGTLRPSVPLLRPSATLAARPDIRGNPNTGRILFGSVGCEGCHGESAQGGYGPRIARVLLSYEQVLTQVRYPLGQMRRFLPSVVSDDEVQDIYAFLQSLP